MGSPRPIYRSQPHLSLLLVWKMDMKSDERASIYLLKFRSFYSHLRTEKTNLRKFPGALLMAIWQKHSSKPAANCPICALWIDIGNSVTVCKNDNNCLGYPPLRMVQISHHSPVKFSRQS